jgi:putative flippase GtrA
MRNNARFFIYLLTGGINTVISLLLFALMVKIGINYLLASCITYVFGIIEGYLFSSLWVFKHKIKFSGLFKYSGVYAIAFVINLVLMYLAVEMLLLDKILAQIIVTGVLTIINYQLVKIFVFHSEKPQGK